MRAFGFLSFGHYGHGRGPGDPSARDMLHEAIELSVGADEIGVNGAYFRVHHFARQAAALARCQRWSCWNYLRSVRVVSVGRPAGRRLEELTT